MLQSAVSRFPMDFSPLLKLLSALSTEGSKQVSLEISKLLSTIQYDNAMHVAGLRLAKFLCPSQRCSYKVENAAIT